MKIPTLHVPKHVTDAVMGNALVLQAYKELIILVLLKQHLSTVWDTISINWRGKRVVIELVVSLHHCTLLG